MFILNEQPLFRLNLFRVQRPLSSCCTDLQLRCNVQEPGRPKPAVLPCITVHVKVCSMVSNCVILDIVKVSTHRLLCQLRNLLRNSCSVNQSNAA